jgi:hypothetical protein
MRGAAYDAALGSALRTSPGEASWLANRSSLLSR